MQVLKLKVKDQHKHVCPSILSSMCVQDRRSRKSPISAAHPNSSNKCTLTELYNFFHLPKQRYKHLNKMNPHNIQYSHSPTEKKRR